MKMDALCVAASTADIDPLLSSKQHEKEKRKKNKCILLVSWLILIMIITISMVLLYVYNIWPFIDDESGSQIDGPPGLFGEWPIYGGNLERQQISPNDVNITIENILNIDIKCNYISLNSVSFDGYITIDDKNRAYFTDYSGFITCIDLDSCTEIWRKNIANLLGYDSNIRMVSRNSVTLYIDKGSELKSVLFGTPNKRIHSIGYHPEWPCYAVSLNIKTGELLWKLNLGEGIENVLCHSHGFIVDKNGDFAYGGLATFGWQNLYYQSYENNKFRGRMIKIDLLTHQIVNEWYSIPSNRGYFGGGIWQFPAIFNDYLVFGTGDLIGYPQHITNCLNGDYNEVDINNSYHYNPCNEDVRNNSFWRCLESDIYIDSLIVLNVTNFNKIISIPLQGVDAWSIFCDGFEPQNTDGCPSHPGPDADLSIVSIYNNSNDSETFYVAAHQKSGMFYVFEIKPPSGTGKVVIAKKIGKWSTMGGGNSFSLAIDDVNKIAIVSITGYADDLYYKQQLADNNVICESGHVEAIDLNTGYTMYQIINPYSKMGDNECNDPEYDEYIDYSFVNRSLCLRSFDGSNMLNSNETCSMYENQECVFYPDISNDAYLPLLSDERGKFYGGITIKNELVFIPSITGDIFIHHIKTGEFIHRLQCPMNENQQEMNRAAVGGGVTVINDRIIFYCGRRINFKYVGSTIFGNQLISMQLNNTNV